MVKAFENLTHRIPYYAYADGAFLLDDGTVFSALKLTGIEMMFMSPEDLKVLKGKIKNVLAVLPKGYVVQIFHDYDQLDDDPMDRLDAKMRSKHPIATEFQQSYRKHLAMHPDIRKVSVTIFIISPVKKGMAGVARSVGKFVRGFSKSGKPTRESELQDRLRSVTREISDQTARIRYAFKNVLSIESEVLGKKDFISLAGKFLNPGVLLPSGRHENGEDSHDCPASNHLTLRETLVHSVIEEHAEYLKIGGRYATILTLKLPSESTQEANSEWILSSIGFPFTWSYNVKIMDTASVNSKLEARQRRKYAFVASSDNPNINSTVSKSEIEQAMTDQKIQGFEWYEVSFTFMVYADSVEELNDKTTALVSILRDVQSSMLIVEHSAQFESFVSALPGLGYRSKRWFLFSSLNMSDLAPLSEPSMGTRDLSCYLLTHRNTLFRFSTFSNEFNNWNQVVIGKIGSGKSFIVNNILTLALMNMDKPRVMILDLGQSFKRTTELWGGEYVTIDLDQPDSGINPLPPRDIMMNRDEVLLGLLDFTVQLILLMVEIPSGNRLHARIIKRALFKTYERVQKRDPILSDFHDTLCRPDDYVSDESDRAIANELSKLMEEYIGDGPYARLFNRESSLTHNSDFFCFDFKSANQNEKLRTIATFIIGGYICRKMVENSLPKFIVFDEFSTTMQHDAGAALCEMIAKNCRKHGVSFITISQQVNDFLKHPTNETLYKQANFKWFLHMDDNLMRDKDSLKITNTDIDWIRDLKTVKGSFAEVYLMYGDRKTLLRLSPDPLTYWASTTDARDKRLLESYLNLISSSPSVATLMELSLVGSAGEGKRFMADASHNQMLAVLKLLASRYPRGSDNDDLERDPVHQRLTHSIEMKREVTHG